MSQTDILIERTGHVATVTVNKAQRRNAFTRAMLKSVMDAAEAFKADEETRAVIFRAEGTDFSVGADIKEPPAESASTSMLSRHRNAEFGSGLMRAIQEIHQPTICAIQGIATGAGACISSACDFRIGAESARIGYGEVKLGINLQWRALPVCVHLVGPARAKQMVMSGKLFDARTMLQWGFLDEVVAASQLDARVRQIADEYAELPPIAVQMIKRSINRISGALDDAIMHMDSDQMLLTSQSEDFREAVRAFSEKRRPRFRGR